MAKKTDFSNINWTKIAKKIQTKSKDDCRNKWNTQILHSFYSKIEFTEEEDEDLIKQLIFKILKLLIPRFLFKELMNKGLSLILKLNGKK